ncbi:glycosyltransferase family 9 protein [Thalassospira profundimaris]|uniref:glycosyltransferase family 9 protein n=1 Tax=Thalassospira profundimaris TaxID=502049 RepID=UPI0002871F2B|nr:glycosyltransferase family 9 protein [Thalassospira profundimaris]EKF10118.1 heptosyltransferase family protein [Thalassospira profundimaris WP0211]
MPRAPHPSRKTFTRFASKQPFQFGLPNVSAELSQSSDNSPIYFTRATSLLRRQVLATAPGVKIKSDNYRLQVLPRDGWGERDFSGKSVLFLIPDDALGDCVGMALFFRALKQRFADIRIGILNAGSASDIFARVPDIEIFQLFISSIQLKRFDHVIDLSEMEGWRDIATMPVNPEEALCEAFGISPIPLEKRNLPKGTRLKVGIVPMASSPLRTLPPKLVSEVIKMLTNRDCDITLVLNAYQGVMKAYKAALSDLGTQNGGNTRIIDGFKTIGDLVKFVGQQDYLIVADSGPAHISKLFQTPGTGIYSSADAKTLQGRHTNLRAWQSDFTGPHCSAPCGLAKLRATSDGKIGCMGSLGLPFTALPNMPERSDPELARALVTNKPVPCVAKLDEDIPAICDLISQDLAKA